jgi:hypothetical protein
MAFDKNQINQSIADFSVKKLLTDLLDAVTGGSFNDVTATAAEINRAADTSARLVSATAATLAVTEADHDGKLIALNKADGIVATLPAATGSGAVFEFIVGTSASGGSYVIKVADATDVMDGMVLTADDTATPVNGVWVTAATTDTITLNGGTQGGLIGDTIRLVDIATNQWVVHGILKQSGSEATPFSATVS